MAYLDPSNLELKFTWSQNDDTTLLIHHAKDPDGAPLFCVGCDTGPITDRNTKWCVFRGTGLDNEGDITKPLFQSPYLDVAVQYAAQQAIALLMCSVPGVGNKGWGRSFYTHSESSAVAQPS